MARKFFPWIKLMGLTRMLGLMLMGPLVSRPRVWIQCMESLPTDFAKFLHEELNIDSNYQKYPGIVAKDSPRDGVLGSWQ